MTPVQLGLVQAGVSAAQSIGNFASQAVFGARNERWAREDATTAFNRQLQLIDSQRAYESPKAQMSRFAEAGLNPNLIYGQLNSFGSPVTAPQAQTASPAAPRFSDINAMAPLQAQLLQAQIRDLNSQSDRRDKLSDAELQKILSEYHLNDEQKKFVTASIGKINDERQNLVQLWQLYDQQKTLNNYEIQKLQKTWQPECDALIAKYQMTQQEAQHFLEYLFAKIANLRAQSNLYDKQAQFYADKHKYFDKVFDDLVSIMKSNAAQADIAKQMADFVNEHKDFSFWFDIAMRLVSGASQALNATGSAVGAVSKILLH